MATKVKIRVPIQTRLVSVPASHKKVLDDADLACTHIQLNGPWGGGNKEVVFYVAPKVGKIALCQACAKLADKADLNTITREFRPV